MVKDETTVRESYYIMQLHWVETFLLDERYVWKGLKADTL